MIVLRRLALVATWDLRQQQVIFRINLLQFQRQTLERVSEETFLIVYTLYGII